MNSQFFSGDTATQTTGTIPVELTPEMRYRYYLDKALGKDVSALAESMEKYEKLGNSKEKHPVEPSLELEPNGTSEEVTEPEIAEVQSKIMKKHIFNVYPEMDDDDHSALKNDIQKNGYDPKYPIWLYDGDILDGWNRQKVCTELNITPVYIDFIGNDSDAIAFVVRSNNRRNLTPIQRACIALEYKPLFEKLKTEAKERQIEGGKNKVRQKIAEPKRDDNKTDSKVAKLFDTNRTYIQKARKIKNENPEIFEKIKCGAETIGNLNKKEIFADVNQWLLPDEYLEKVKTVFGMSELYPATSDLTQEMAQAANHITFITNELDKNWNGNVFVNPPYSTTEVIALADMFVEEYNSGHINQGIFLTDNSTYTDWFHKLMNNANLTCFTDSRANFQNKGNKTKKTNGQVFFYIGDNGKKFIEEFTDIGIVMKKA